MGFPAVFRVPDADCFQHIGRIRCAEQIIGRCTAVCVPPVPKVERQAGQAAAAAGLPAFFQSLLPDNILLEIKDILNMLSGFVADAHRVKKCLVVRISTSAPYKALLVKSFVIPIFELNRHFVPPFVLGVEKQDPPAGTDDKSRFAIGSFPAEKAEIS